LQQNLPTDWVENPPEDIETQAILLERYSDSLQEKSPRGDTLRYLFKAAKRFYSESVETLRYNEPQAFFIPSYEQALLLNAWVWGINFPICFSANRIGKTAGFIFNAILWIFPNNPQWRCFQPYKDYHGRLVQLIPRPSIDNLIPIQKHYEKYPHLVGNLYKQPYETENIDRWNTSSRLAPTLFAPAYPYPPIPRGGQFWLGAPDNDFHKRIIMRQWRKFLPRASILKDSESDRMFIISTASQTNPKTTAHELVCKSYESEDTKWSGDAVHGIILTEGFEQAVLDEIKNRLTNEAFASWDYTPADPRNTGKKVALAYKVFKKEEELPLRSFVFTKFSVRDAPAHIIPKEKKDDLIRMWENREAGKARLDGEFFSSSGLVLDALRREFHCLDWTFDELQTRFPNGRIYRGLDPGLDHPSSCAWAYLSTNNIWFIYRFYSRRNTTISQRCQDIITLSNNEREKFITKNGQTQWREVHTRPSSEVAVATPTDYHAFKRDERTGQSFSLEYLKEGLVITESTHMGPEDRAIKANSLLDPNANPHIAHPQRGVAPGARIFFLIRMPGVALALDKFDQLFWDRYRGGELRGEPKDKVPLHGDDELDALCNIVCSPYIWTRNEPRRREPQEQKAQEQYYTAPLDTAARLKAILEDEQRRSTVGFT